MGRDVTGLFLDKKASNVAKSNGINQVKVHVNPRIAVERVETNGYEADDNNAKGSAVEDGHEKQDVLAVKSNNCGPDTPDAKTHKVDTLKTNEKKLISPIKPATGSAATEALQTSPPIPTTLNLSREKQNSGVNDVDGAESITGIVKTNYLDSPKTSRASQPMLPLQSRTVQHDEEDNLSLASSAATSVRTIKSRITVPVAPSFVCVERAERRKEYYTKLEEKHKALEKEKLEYAARTKEEEAAAVKQMRKSMAYKANPVPTFYREGPPPKVELKKFPVTRAKSPNLTRRKSCSDATKSTPEDKGVCARVKRHSIGVYKEGSSATNTPKNKDVTGRRKSTPGVSKAGNTSSATKSKSILCRQKGTEVHKSKEHPRQGKETSKASRTKDQAGADNADVCVVEEVPKTPMSVEHVADGAVAVEMSNSPHVTTEQISTNITISEEAEKPSPSTMAEQKTSDITVET